MQPRILAARMDGAQKRIVTAVTTLAQGRELPPLPWHRDPQQAELFRTEWIADRLEEMAQPETAEKPKKKGGAKDD